MHLAHTLTHNLPHPSQTLAPPVSAGRTGGQLYLVGSALDVTLWITGGLKRLAPELQVMTFRQADQAARHLRLTRPHWPNLILLSSASSSAFLNEVQGESWAADLPLLLLTDSADDPDTQRTLSDTQAIRASLQRPSRGSGEGVLRLLALYSGGQLSL